MMRSMYSGVAGLKTHQTRMDVIGNNIANVNTVGYKSQSALFSELLYQNSSTASGPNDTTGIGGINAKQIGLGVKMASISTNITQAGSAETTNNPFDLCITGSSFFIVNNGRENMFTRDGSFKVDAAGNLVLSSNGYKVMGWLPDPETGQIKPDTVTALTIMSAANMTYPPEATTQAYVSGIVDAESPEVNSDDGKIMNLNFFDSRGYSYTAKMAIKKLDEDPNSTVNNYSCELISLLDASGNDVKDTVGAQLGNKYIKTETKLNRDKDYTLAEGVTAGSYTIKTKANADGEYKIYTITDGGLTGEVKDKDGNDITPAEGLSPDEMWKDVAKAFGSSDPDSFMHLVYTDTTTDPSVQNEVKGKLATIIGLSNVLTTDTITFDGKNIDGLTISFSKADGSFVQVNEGGKTTELQFGTSTATQIAGSNFEDITIDFSTLSNVSNEKVSTASATNGSLDNKGGGRRIGKMSGVSIQNDGKIYCTYDNGQSKLVGQIAAASFANPSGLQKEGDNLYIATQNSGDFDGIGIDITSDGGYMTTGELEMSNVDLSGELTGMIVTQRGFQANSRIITVSDTMLEELINLKR